MNKRKGLIERTDKCVISNTLQDVPSGLKLDTFFKQAYDKSYNKHQKTILAVIDKNLRAIKTQYHHYFKQNSISAVQGNNAIQTFRSNPKLSDGQDNNRTNSEPGFGNFMKSQTSIINAHQIQNLPRKSFCQDRDPFEIYNLQDQRISEKDEDTKSLRSKDDNVRKSNSSFGSCSSDGFQETQKQSEKRDYYKPEQQNLYDKNELKKLQRKDSSTASQQFQSSQADKLNDYNASLMNQIEPYIKQIMMQMCQELQTEYPYLPSVMYQMSGDAQTDKKKNVQIKHGGGLPSMSGKISNFQLIDSSQINEHNKNLLKKNAELEQKNEDLIKQMDDMRINYQKDLNQKSALDYLQKKKWEQQADEEGDEFAQQIQSQVTYFEVQDCVDSALREQLNKKIDKCKELYKEWHTKQMDYTQSLNRKICLYESMSTEFYGLIGMPLEEIFKGVAAMDEKAEDIWKHLVKGFGDVYYFYDVIDKQYGELFAQDSTRTELAIDKAMQKSQENEKMILEQCTRQLQNIVREKKELEDKLITTKAQLTEQIGISKSEGVEIGKNIMYDEMNQHIEKLQKENLQLIDEKQELQQIAKNPMELIEKEKLKTVFAKLVLNTRKFRKNIPGTVEPISSQRFQEFLDGKTSLQYEENIQQIYKKYQENEDMNIDMRIETNYLKRERMQKLRKIHQLEVQIEELITLNTNVTNQLNSQIEKNSVSDLEFKILNENLEAQGELLNLVQQECKDTQNKLDKISRGTMQPPKASEIQNMFKRTRCKNAYSGWQNYNAIRTIGGKMRDVQTTTDLKDVNKEFILKPKIARSSGHVSIDHDCLEALREVPVKETEMQYDQGKFIKYLRSTGIMNPKISKGDINKAFSGGVINDDLDQVDSDDSDFNNAGAQTSFKVDQKSQCCILDTPQLNCFIFDALCDDQYLKKLIDTKRKFEIVDMNGDLDMKAMDEAMEAIENIQDLDTAELLYDEMDNFAQNEQKPTENTLSSNKNFIGGIKIKDKYEKLPERQREEMRKKISQIQERLNIENVHSQKYPELKGRYKDLWDDVEQRKERMQNLRTKVDLLVKQQLSKTLFQKNTDIQSFNNNIILSSFMEQMRLFIGRQVNKDIQIKIPSNQSPDNIHIELQGQQQKILPLSSKDQTEYLSPRMVKDSSQVNLKDKSPLRMFDLNDDETIRTCLFYQGKIKQILKSKKAAKKNNKTATISQGSLSPKSMRSKFSRVAALSHNTTAANLPHFQQNQANQENNMMIQSRSVQNFQTSNEKIYQQLQQQNQNFLAHSKSRKNSHERDHNYRDSLNELQHILASKYSGDNANPTFNNIDFNSQGFINENGTRLQSQTMHNSKDKNYDLGPILLVADNNGEQMMTFENQIGTMTNSVKDSIDNGLNTTDIQMEIDNLQLTNDLNKIRNAQNSSFFVRNKNSTNKSLEQIIDSKNNSEIENMQFDIMVNNQRKGSVIQPKYSNCRKLISKMTGNTKISSNEKNQGKQQGPLQNFQFNKQIFDPSALDEQFSMKAAHNQKNLNTLENSMPVSQMQFVQTMASKQKQLTTKRFTQGTKNKYVNGQLQVASSAFTNPLHPMKINQKVHKQFTAGGGTNPFRASENKAIKSSISNGPARTEQSYGISIPEDVNNSSHARLKKMTKNRIQSSSSTSKSFALSRLNVKYSKNRLTSGKGQRHKPALQKNLDKNRNSFIFKVGEPLSNPKSPNVDKVYEFAEVGYSGKKPMRITSAKIGGYDLDSSNSPRILNNIIRYPPNQNARDQQKIIYPRSHSSNLLHQAQQNQSKDQNLSIYGKYQKPQLKNAAIHSQSFKVLNSQTNSYQFVASDGKSRLSIEDPQQSGVYFNQHSGKQSPYISVNGKAELLKSNSSVLAGQANSAVKKQSFSSSKVYQDIKQM